ncbi:P63C domain-containing protein [Bacillus sp. AFS088145]|uniref:P63C domain-containing protein n=1 Tax=Bacillus sp. AFS088145 TaxID=2033514 RepID=UPI000BFA6F1F|nr:P63C domain-containing protein [Bacillus sp. AFS088145]PFH91388.1 hypothetical protein COI44_01930 [Bacillus sp. AFS088145]
MEIIDKTSIPKETHPGTVNIGGWGIKCAVLENKKRIITQGGLFDAFGRPRKGEKRIDGLPSIIGANNLSEFVSDELREQVQPIKYVTKRGRVSEGYDAEVIASICYLYIDADDKGKLKTNQHHILEKAKILIRALAVTGINALIDEATGYQKFRDDNELEKIFEKYLGKELSKLQKLFPEEFYEEAFRLYGFEYTGKTQRPMQIGNFTKKYVYDSLPLGVVEKLKDVKLKHESNRSSNMWRYLSEDFGVQALKTQLDRVTTTMQLSDDLAMFKKNYQRAFAKEIAARAEQEKIKEYKDTLLPIE